MVGRALIQVEALIYSDGKALVTNSSFDHCILDGNFKIVETLIEAGMWCKLYDDDPDVFSISKLTLVREVDTDYRYETDQNIDFKHAEPLSDEMLRMLDNL